MADLPELRRLLADSPHLSRVARWQHEQWGRLYPETSFRAWQEELRGICGTRGVPSVFLALEEGRPVGTASLVEDDMEVRRELTPWLASVFVLPEWRGKGVASHLVRRVEHEARQAGIERLYLFTPDRQALYRRLGWETHEALVYRGEEVTIMTRRLVT
ncbi:Acetyltransferase (GNAT) family protein [Modicisalibacter ilicicola DSM 19980]|uniref:Acetyltransferase (GNAT) family protein n=1 Tax=Modicisalibacter ilicicola DSM 19980 TaxID=1121942 RepID=A0A1M5DV77_9GAMM|nr:GNAT family N-acetyltransferase [Halomonas ilicicola]SHF70722.1 Acetyltransferase (GNAT) family protein [Halomonas ilicicola DSM 19980]